jgi:hypothetical protein
MLPLLPLLLMKNLDYSAGAAGASAAGAKLNSRVSGSCVITPGSVFIK